MAIDIPQFWKLAIEGQLLTPEECEKLGAEYGHVKGAAVRGNARTLAEWLVSEQRLSRFQTNVLLDGQTGPFVFGEYRLRNVVEQGRMAGLYEAEHLPTRHLVWLHFLSGKAAVDPDEWPRTAARGQAHCDLAHPQLLRCWELVDVQTYKFLVLEQLEGGLLFEQVLERGPLPAEEAVRVVRQIAQGLAALHEKRLVHGDVHPLNVWRLPSENHKLLRDPLRPLAAPDFSRAQDPTALLAADYAAPELQKSGQKPDVLTDIYGLGGILYFLIAGQPPFPDGDLPEKLRRHQQDAVPPLDQVAGAPPSVAEACNYLLAKRRAVRTQTAQAVVNQLTPLLGSSRFDRPETQPPTLHPFEQWVSRKQANLRAEGEALAAREADEANAVPVIAGVGVAAPVDAVETTELASVATDEDQAALETARGNRVSTGDRLVWMVMGSIGVFSLVALVMLYALLGNREQPVAENDAPKPPGQQPVRPTKNPSPGRSSDGQGTAPADGTPFRLVSDDEKTLWAPPTWGEPIPFNFMPPGGQLFMVARPSDLVSHPQGPAVLDALGPEFAAAQSDFESIAGLALADVERVILGLYDHQPQPKPAMLVTASQPIEPNSLWGNPPATAHAGQQYFTKDGWALYLPPSGDGRTFLMGDPREIQAVIDEVGANAPVLRKQVADLLAETDQQRQVVILGSPKYLLTSGQTLLSGPSRKVLGPLDAFFGEQVVAASLSLHLSDHAFVEMRVISNDPDTLAVARTYREKLNEMPSQFESYLAAIDPPPYWRKLAFRLPGMIRYLHRQSRIAASGDQAVVNAALPAVAAPNLIAGTELTIFGAAGGSGPVVAGPAEPKTLEEKLAAKATLAFGQTSLEFAIRDLGQETGIPMKIIGPDLQLDGITRNQQVRDFDQRDKPVSDILTAIVMKANPVTTVTKPSEADQKLIWVVGPDPESGAPIVLITTRAAAEKKKYTLPSTFKLQP